MSNYHLFGYERINGSLGDFFTSNRPNSLEMEMLKRWIYKMFFNSSKFKFPKNLLKFLVNEENAYLLSLNFLMPSRNVIDRMFSHYFNSKGNERLPDGSRFLGSGDNYVLNGDEIDSVRDLLGVIEPLHVSNSCLRYKLFKYGDAIYSSELSSRRGGKFVGIRFDAGGPELKEYFAVIGGFLEYINEGTTYFLMQVDYCHTNPISRLCWKDSNGDPKFVLKNVRLDSKYKDRRNCVVPINRIYARYGFLKESLAIEINMKLRI
jgi:hypothetical protein